jgi:hypothetical protein
MFREEGTWKDEDIEGDVKRVREGLLCWLFRGDVVSCTFEVFLWSLLSCPLVPMCCVQMSNLSTSQGIGSLGLGFSD